MVAGVIVGVEGGVAGMGDEFRFGEKYDVSSLEKLSLGLDPCLALEATDAGMEGGAT